MRESLARGSSASSTTSCGYTSGAPAGPAAWPRQQGQGLGSAAGGSASLDSDLALAGMEDLINEGFFDEPDTPGDDGRLSRGTKRKAA